MGNKYHQGEIVYASSNPRLPLIVITYLDGLYHCRVQTDPTRQELVYPEAELAWFPTVEVATDAAEKGGGTC
jgi:predicted hotdog family 3-hydroxylacyl-ACP dehydratase